MSDFTEVNKKRSWKLINKYGIENVNSARKVKELAKQEWPKSFQYPSQGDEYLQEFVQTFKQVFYEAKEQKPVDQGYKTALALEKTKLEAELAYLQHRLQYVIQELEKC